MQKFSKIIIFWIMYVVMLIARDRHSLIRALFREQGEVEAVREEHEGEGRLGLCLGE